MASLSSSEKNSCPVCQTRAPTYSPALTEPLVWTFKRRVLDGSATPGIEHEDPKSERYAGPILRDVLTHQPLIDVVGPLRLLESKRASGVSIRVLDVTIAGDWARQAITRPSVAIVSGLRRVIDGRSRPGEVCLPR